MTLDTSRQSAAELTLAEITEGRRLLGDRIRETPSWRWQNLDLDRQLGSETEVFLKLELFQHTGTFKPRGALLNMLRMTPNQLAGGVTAVSAGNHAIAVGYCARILGSSAKVVMPKTANAARVAACREQGAEVVLVDNVGAAFEEVKRIERDEQRAFIHPFEGRLTATGTATLGLELAHQVADLDAVVVPIGGGGLCAGVAAAIKQIQPRCQVIGVEPEGADSMHRSFAAGEPRSIAEVRTIADSLGAPHTAPFTFALCRRYVDRLVKVTDDEIRASMLRIFRLAKLAVEPAGATAAAALFGPLSSALRGRRVALIVCGSNIDPVSFHHHLAAAEAAGGA